jgi:multidrug efflux pump subunit AcrB
MSGHQSDADLIAHTRNTARFLTENRHIAWVLLVATLLWGVYGYVGMPKRKDPAVPVLYAAAVCPWPGASAEKIEQLVTRRIEERIAENARVERIESTSRGSVAVIVIALDERTEDARKELDDIAIRLASLRDLPPGAGPIEFLKDFGDTAALMLTVASPKVSGIELELRARGVRAAIEETRRGVAGPRVTVVVPHPASVAEKVVARQRDLIAGAMVARGLGRDLRTLGGSGFVGADFATDLDDEAIGRGVQQLIDENLLPSELPPDVWTSVLVRDPADTEVRMQAAAGDRYTYRDLDRFTDLIKRALQTVPQVSKITRAGLLPEQIYLEYSQERLASYGLQLTRLSDILRARNITIPGGLLDVRGKRVAVDPSGEFTAASEIGDVIVGTTAEGRPIYLRDGAEVIRAYQTPARYLNFYQERGADGQFHTSRAVTLAVQMRPGEQIEAFGEAVDAVLGDLQKTALPSDLIVARPSDQPLQVRESVGLFMRSLYEAIALVILVALVGFWEWRAALLMAIAIPLTLAMTFGMMYVLQVDVQQVSIASLIIALGLLVDDPVVAGDAIKRELEAGHPPVIAAWLGPTKLATAILFATITNIVAYLPFLLIQGNIGRFIYSLPVVLACSLVASRIVSMTFIPLLGYYLLRRNKTPDPPIEYKRAHGFTGAYYRVASWALDHRWVTLGIATVLLVAGLFASRGLKVQFFPKDLSYLSYVDVWLPEDATLSATRDRAQAAEAVIRRVAHEFGAHHTGEDGKPRQVLESLTTFVGGGGPRFWFSVAPELFQPNYAQIILKVEDKHDTRLLVPLLQRALAGEVPGARIDVRELENGKPVGIPVGVRVSGDNPVELRRVAEEVKRIFRAVPRADRVRDDWGADGFSVKLRVDPDRANLAGVSNLDVALSSVSGMNGFPLTVLRDGDQQIPVVARLRPEERARITDIQNLYVYSQVSPQRVPLRQVSHVEYAMQTEKIRRRNHFRTIAVSAFPVPGALPSEVLRAARPQIDAFARTLPPGYRLVIGGEYEEQVKGFRQLAVVMLVSVGAIFMALVFQFRSAIKPLIVFSAIPFGVVGALLGLDVMGAPFGFMAFLGIASLVGVIVSHIIVLFDFIEEQHGHGAPLREALLDAGIVRLRPVMVTVGATVFGLIPLAMHGGPLWEGLCYTQIAGLTVATGVTLVLVPVLYAIFVLDLKIVQWDETTGVGR